MAPKSVTFRRHDHLVSVLFGDLLSHSYNITFSMFLYLVSLLFDDLSGHSYPFTFLMFLNFLFVQFLCKGISYHVYMITITMFMQP